MSENNNGTKGRRKSSVEEEMSTTPSDMPNVNDLSSEQKAFLDAMNNLIFAAQELSYTVALVPSELEEKYPELKDLIESSKNVVRATYNFHKLIKARAIKP